jgi:sarcosine oxidase subunit delta
MLLIPCPNCGEREESEFVYGGRSIKYPALDKSVASETWHQVLHLGDSSSENSQEFWYHQFGCECWFEIARNVITHEINTPSIANTPVFRDER